MVMNKKTKKLRPFFFSHYLKKKKKMSTSTHFLRHAIDCNEKELSLKFYLSYLKQDNNMEEDNSDCE